MNVSMIRYQARETAAFSAVRLEAVYGSTYKVLSEIKRRDASFKPTTLLDFGSGQARGPAGKGDRDEEVQCGSQHHQFRGTAKYSESGFRAASRGDGGELPAAGPGGGAGLGAAPLGLGPRHRHTRLGRAGPAVESDCARSGHGGRGGPQSAAGGGGGGGGGQGGRGGTAGAGPAVRYSGEPGGAGGHRILQAALPVHPA